MPMLGKRCRKTAPRIPKCMENVNMTSNVKLHVIGQSNDTIYCDGTRAAVIGSGDMHNPAADQRTLQESLSHLYINKMELAQSHLLSNVGCDSRDG